MELRIGIHAFSIEAVKKSGGGGAIKTTIVKAQTYFGHGRSFRAFPLGLRSPVTPAKLLTMLGKTTKVKRGARCANRKNEHHKEKGPRHYAAPRTEFELRLFPGNPVGDVRSNGHTKILVLISFHHQKNPEN